MTDDSFKRRILRRNRALREMLDLARRVVADGMITEDEAEVFRTWLDENPSMVGVWPCDVLVRRFRRIFRTGELSDEDRKALSRELTEIAGAGSEERGEFGRLHVEESDDDPDAEDDETREREGDEGI